MSCDGAPGRTLFSRVLWLPETQLHAGASSPHTTIPLLTYRAQQALTWHVQLSQQRMTSQNRHAPALDAS